MFTIDRDGETIRFDEARMGQIQEVRKFLRSLPRPSPQPLNYDGVLDLLTRGATEALPDDLRDKLSSQQIENHLREVRRMGRQIINEQLLIEREANSYWPPDPDSLQGLHAIFNSDEGPEMLIRLSMEAAGSLSGDEEARRRRAHEVFSGLKPHEFNRAVETFFDMVPRKDLPETEDTPDPKLEKGGDEKVRGKSGSRQTTTKSTPSS